MSETEDDTKTYIVTLCFPIFSMANPGESYVTQEVEAESEQEALKAVMHGAEMNMLPVNDPHVPEGTNVLYYTRNVIRVVITEKPDT